MPAISVDKVIDTTGAGDAFLGGIIAGDVIMMSMTMYLMTMYLLTLRFSTNFSTQYGTMFVQYTLF